MNEKLCECGCGGKTKIITITNLRKSLIKGEYRRFIHGHNPQKKGKESLWWKGGKIRDHQGYALIRDVTHVRASSIGYVKESLLIAENILGKPLPKDAIIHHIDGVRDNNAPINLVVCQDHFYHRLIHVRTRAFNACGFSHYRSCKCCKKYDDPINLKISGDNIYHRKCINKYNSETNRKRKEKITQVAA